LPLRCPPARGSSARAGPSAVGARRPGA
jgi:hypothetical protein